MKNCAINYKIHYPTAERPATLALGPPTDPSDNNFFTQQARLQIEARMALAQAKDMAHMQMEVSSSSHIVTKNFKQPGFVLPLRLNVKSKECAR